MPPWSRDQPETWNQRFTYASIPETTWIDPHMSFSTMHSTEKMGTMLQKKNKNIPRIPFNSSSLGNYLDPSESLLYSPPSLFLYHQTILPPRAFAYLIVFSPFIEHAPIDSFASFVGDHATTLSWSPRSPALISLKESPGRPASGTKNPRNSRYASSSPGFILLGRCS